jgi:NADH-quinone oxidoreductase subunit A
VQAESMSFEPGRFDLSPLKLNNMVYLADFRERRLLTSFGYIILFLFVAVFVAVAMLLTPVVLRMIGLVPKKPNMVKNSTFECGMETSGKTWVRFNFRYYFYALLFLALDVLVLFLYPWAIASKQLGYAGLAVISIFIILVLVGYIYAWKKKVLEWK